MLKMKKKDMETEIENKKIEIQSSQNHLLKQQELINLLLDQEKKYRENQSDIFRKINDQDIENSKVKQFNSEVSVIEFEIAKSDEVFLRILNLDHFQSEVRN